MSSTPAPEPTVTAPAPQSPASAPVAVATVTAPAKQSPAPEPTVTAPAKQSALVRFGLPILGIILVLLVFINTIQNTSINGNIVKVNDNIVTLDTNLSETTKIAKAGNKTATEALALAKEAVAAVEKVAKTVDDSKKEMVAEGDKNRAVSIQLAEHLNILVGKVKEGNAKTQGDVAELQKSVEVSTKQSSDVSAAQVAQIASQLDEIKAQLASAAAPVAPQTTPTPAIATKSDILSGTKGGSPSGKVSSSKTEWKRYEISAHTESKEFCARKARNGDIRLEMKGRVTLIQRFSGWSNQHRESVSAVPPSGYTVFMDANTVAFRPEDEESLIIWERDN